MTVHTKYLPQLAGSLFLADGGIETTLIFREGIDLPYFAAYRLLRNEDGKEPLRKYFRSYARLAKASATGVVLESATWRASADWGALLGDDPESLAELNRQGILLLEELRREPEFAGVPIVISGCIGPRGDGYKAGKRMTESEATRYHSFQARVLAAAGADLITGVTMTYPEEAIGIALAARDAGVPVAISFTVETDGRLPSGHSLQSAIEAVDAATAMAPAYYMINCAHPEHFAHVLDPDASWTGRIRGLRANASILSHAELDEATQLHEGDPDELAASYRELMGKLPALAVLGGCCGTDDRHIGAIANACISAGDRFDVRRSGTRSETSAGMT